MRACLRALSGGRPLGHISIYNALFFTLQAQQPTAKTLTCSLAASLVIGFVNGYSFFCVS